MNGPQHYAEAERLAGSITHPDAGKMTLDEHKISLAAAQVHATLALAAAMAEPIVQAWTGGEGSGPVQRAWTQVIS